MARGKLKMMKQSSGPNTKEISKMFQEMLGIGEDDTALDVQIIFEKYEKLQTQLKRYIKLIDLILISKAIQYYSFIERPLREYQNVICKHFDTLFVINNLDELQKLSIKSLSEEQQETIKNTYKKLKNSVLIESIMVTCKNLVNYSDSLDSIELLSDTFLLAMPGDRFCPINGAEQVNFKLLYCNEQLSDKDRDFLLKILHKMYIISYEVYDLISSPDINVDEFVEIIMISIKDVRKKIPRCDAAFNKIINAVGLLRNNFNGYYKNFVATNNPSIIMESFITDVSKETPNPSPILAAQFTRIIAYYNKIAANSSNMTPQAKQMMGFMNKTLSEINEYSEEFTKDVNLDTLPEDILAQEANEIIIPDFAKDKESIISVEEDDEVNLDENYEFIEQEIEENPKE